tara:strand:+ start:38756 stop:44014 length:5259 start_codon:yes stop_codon:yes gene_type:complete
MDRRRSSLLLAFLFVFGSFAVPLLENNSSASSESKISVKTLYSDAFVGFTGEHSTDFWNQTPWPSQAKPEGFDFLTVYDYSDVGVLINNNSDVSKTIGWAFVNARNISEENIFFFNHSNTPTKETINRNEFNEYFAGPFLEMLANRTSTDELNYLVSTKGTPLRVNGGNDKASFDQEFSLLGGSFNSSIGADYWFSHGYGPLADGEMKAFSRAEYGFFLMSRLTGYTVETALGLIEKANNSLGQRGIFALDLATNRNESGYKFWNDDLYTAQSELNGTMRLPTLFDETSEFLTNVSNVMGYASWGSNDGNWGTNLLPNAGFDTVDTSYSSGSRYWNSTLPTLSSGDSFQWSTQSEVKKDGSSALEASVSAQCSQESGNGTQGILAEYFDNDGVSFNTGSMPSLIDRTPDHVRLEPSLQYSSSSQAYPGLDNRFKNDWGARFSGLIEIPETGNWTFYLTSDDGSELWINGQSLVTNYGSHGMVERSQYGQYDAGKYDFKIEFFQGGGPHGLQLSWSGPNQSKSFVPASAFSLAENYIPSESNLIHHWEFEDGSGLFANDSVNSTTNLTLNNMNSSNWRTCVDGGCLWYDGVDDWLEVDVEDWVGNFSVSQWVWANSTTLPIYSSVFAVDHNAGSNASFQHAIYNGDWRLANNQSYTFGQIEAQEWAHLVTVFDNGTAHQYFNGVLVRSTTFSPGELNNIDVYKLGVNRGGSAYFQGMIDNVMIWNAALEDHEITTLHRDIYKDCSAYSGNGQAAASIEQTYEFPAELQDHAWVVSLHGQRLGDVYGEFSIEVEGLDENGTVLSDNQSDGKNFAPSWESRTFRFRPHANAIAFRIRVPLDLVATSTDGSIYLDSMNLHPIRPHNSWIDGSIAETAVSTSGRSFKWDTSYGQSLVADLLEDGVSGAKGYVYEPYLTAVGTPSTLMVMYANGFNLAESHAAANLQAGWMGVTVGDPKMAPYADLNHDINLIDVRQIDNASYMQPSTIQLAIENLGMSSSNGTLLVQDIQGNIEMYRSNLTLPSGDQHGSSVLYNFTITPEKTGWMDLRIRYSNSTAGSQERNTANNMVTLRIWVNAPPSVEKIYCDAEIYARGDNFICTIEATDDLNVTSVDVDWAVTQNISNLTNLQWYTRTTGRVDALRWQSSITLPTSMELGHLVIRASAHDESQQIGVTLETDIAAIVDAQAQWFGPHFDGIDSPSWSGINQLPYRPTGGLFRGEATTVTMCVLDADYDLIEQHPILTASAGQVSNLSYAAQGDSSHHCYIGSYLREVSSSLDDIEFEIRQSDGALLQSRIVSVSDRAPFATIEIVDSEGRILDSVRGGGNEYAQIHISDSDDPSSSVTGDLMIQWPGAEQSTIPVDSQNIASPLLIQLPQISTALEGGELELRLELTGQHAAVLSEVYTLPFLLTIPEILSSHTCDDNGPMTSLRFGNTGYLLVHFRSERPIQSMQTTLSQLGWSVPAPSLGQISAQDPSIQNCLPLNTTLADDEQLHKFRLRLDGTFIDGDGQILFSIYDVDGLSKSLNVPVEFYHAIPVTTLTAKGNLTAGEILTFSGSVDDADGIDDITCTARVSQNQTQLAQLQVTLLPKDTTTADLDFQFPTTAVLNNLTLFVEVTCIDSWLQSNTSTLEFTLLPAPICDSCQQTNSTNDAVETSLSRMSVAVFVLATLTVLLVLTSFLKKSENTEEPVWASEELQAENQPEDSKQQSQQLEKPTGWSDEQYREWLEGEMPDGWTVVQWVLFSNEQIDLLELQDTK